MSNARAIAAVTAAMRALLQKQVPVADGDLSGLKVTVGPPDLARKNITSTQINLFLYQVVTNAGWSNQDMPFRVRPGETSPPPLALNLHFLLTAYGNGEIDDDALSHRVLGGAMIVLHSHPLLGREELKAALDGNDIDRQIERIRITALPIGVEELSKLWTVFQTPYRTSVAYEVTVVLIDSLRSAPAPLPVLRRGDADRGPFVIGQLTPVLSSLEIPGDQPAIRLGERFAVTGTQLGPSDTAVVTGPQMTGEIILAPESLADGKLQFRVADAPEDPDSESRWCPGFFTVAVRREGPDGLPPLSSNALSLAFAPRVTVKLDSIDGGTVKLTIDCSPRIRAGQGVVVIFGDRQTPIKADAITNPPDEKQPTTLSAEIPGVSSGSYVVRLRVDGVDSIPVIRPSDTAPPSFDAAQTVVVP